MSIGEAIKIVRVRTGLRQKELAQRSGFSQSLLSMIENDRRRPDVSMVETICRAMDVPAQLVFLLACQPEPDKERYKPALERLGLAMLELLEAVRKAPAKSTGFLGVGA